MKKLRKKTFLDTKRSANLGNKNSHFQPIVMNGKNAKICIYKSAEISAWAGALKKCENKRLKKVSFIRFKTILKKKSYVIHISWCNFEA